MSAWMYVNGLLHEQSRDTWNACLIKMYIDGLNDNQYRNPNEGIIQFKTDSTENDA